MSVVTRRDIRDMSRSEINRFFDAVDQMMRNENGAGTSEFYRIASYHGQPPPIYCEHGRETFPGWHRIYLYEFEQALQAADRQINITRNDRGQIAIPYWYNIYISYIYIIYCVIHKLKGIGHKMYQQVYQI